MRERKVMKRLFAVLLGCLVSTGAYAQQSSVPKEIAGYKNLTVSFSKSAGDCNLKDATLFANHLKDKLAGIGIEQRDDVYSAVRLGISAQRFGAVGGQCVTMVELTFQGALSKDNIRTSDEGVMAAVNRLGVIPLVLYKEGQFAVQPQVQPSAGGESTTSQKAALRMIEGLVDSLKAKRQ